MAEPPSNTANHQRLKEMMVHLTPKEAVIPYTLCTDCEENIWVASKGGLFKLDRTGQTILFERKNPFPKKMAPYTQVLYTAGRVVYVMTEDKAALTEFRILDLDGDIKHEQFIDGKIQSLAINTNGDIFMTKQPVAGADESIIYKSSMDCPLDWEELSSAYDYCFQALCCFDENTLFVATSTMPVNMYSKQTIKRIDSRTGKIHSSFTAGGKDDGQIYFPRCIQRYEDDLLVLDKTGRFQRFQPSGSFLGVSARIDAYLGNGFIVRGDEAIVVCSGIVLDKSSQTICDDWIEAVKLNGSSWV